MGIELTFVDLENAADGDVLGAIKENTKVRPFSFNFSQPLTRII